MSKPISWLIVRKKIMAVNGLFKEFGEAFGRLFDHRPVLQGEISYFQREFEDRRGNHEEVRLLRSLEYGREINEKLIPQITEQLHLNFPKFLSAVSQAVDLSQHIMDKESKSGKNEWLEQRQLHRAEELNGFLEKVASRVCDIDKEFMTEIDLVETHYQELKEKLRLTEHKDKQIVVQDCDPANQLNIDEVSQEIASMPCADVVDSLKNILRTQDIAGIKDMVIADRNMTELKGESTEERKQV